MQTGHKGRTDENEELQSVAGVEERCPVKAPLCRVGLAVSCHNWNPSLSATREYPPTIKTDSHSDFGQSAAPPDAAAYLLFGTQEC